MIICNSRKFTFVHIHKAGGTSVEKALDAHLAWNDLILGGSPLGQRVNESYRYRYKLHKHSSVADIENVCGPEYTDNYYLFALVRHPVDRICSLYNFVASRFHHWGLKHGLDPMTVDLRRRPKLAKKSPMLKWPSSRTFRVSKTFSDFIRNEELPQDVAFQTQVSRLTSLLSGRTKGDIYRLEDRTTFVDAIRERLGIEFEMPHENKSQIQQIRPADISAADRQFLEEQFRDDLRTFGY